MKVEIIIKQINKFMEEEEQKRKEQWLPTKKKKTKKTISGFGELKKSVQRQKKKNSNQSSWRKIKQRF